VAIAITNFQFGRNPQEVLSVTHAENCNSNSGKLRAFYLVQLRFCVINSHVYVTHNRP